MFQHVGTPHHIKAGVGKGEGFGPTTRKDCLRIAVPASIAGRNLQGSTREINPYDRGTTQRQTSSRQPTTAPEVKHASSLPASYNRVKVGKACWIHTRQHMQLAAWLPPTLCQSVIDGEIVH